MLPGSRPKYSSLLVAALFCASVCAWGQTPNYDESIVRDYTLPDPLIFNDGKPVRSARDWKQRREELIELFAMNVYGHSPKAPKTSEF